MKYEFSFYTPKDFDEIEDLILQSYGYPLFGLSRMEFSHGLHPKFLGFPDMWERTVGVFRENGRIAACAINEGNDEGEVFFLFDNPQRAQDRALLREMLFFAQTTMSCVTDPSHVRRFVRVAIPKEHTVLRELAEEKGFQEDGEERIRIRPFGSGCFPVSLPEGYSFADGRETPAFYLANVHMAAFQYSIQQVPNCAAAFAGLRRQKHYDPRLDLCILDPRKRPVAMAVLWYDEKMPYCELEPLGVAWWERRKGLATAILNEGANRIMALYPNCRGMTGGDQPFYERLGFEVKASVPIFKWETEIYPSWDPRSKEMDFSIK